MASIAYDVALILLQARTPADEIFGNDRGAFQTRFTMQPKWIALGLFVAGIASLLIGAGLPYLKHLAIGLTSVLA